MTDPTMNSFQEWAKGVAEPRGFMVEPVGNWVRLTRAGVSEELFTKSGVRAAVGLPAAPPRPRVTYECAKCGSRDVTHDAVVRWDEDAQEWSVSNVFDNADCDDCEGETRLKEVSL